MTYQEVKLISWRVGVTVFGHVVVPESKEIARKAKGRVVSRGVGAHLKEPSQLGRFEGENTSSWITTQSVR